MVNFTSMLYNEEDYEVTFFWTLAIQNKLQSKTRSQMEETFLTGNKVTMEAQHLAVC